VPERLARTNARNFRPVPASSPCSTLPVVYDSAVHWAAEGVPESVMIAKPFAPPQIITALSALLNAL
jgi:hypothetical protein